MHRSIEDICGQVIEFDNCIRFAGFATKTGKLIAYKYRKGSIPLLTSDQRQLSVLDNALRMRTKSYLTQLHRPGISEMCGYTLPKVL
jgi:hypothetical protein